MVPAGTTILLVQVPGTCCSHAVVLYSHTTRGGYCTVPVPFRTNCTVLYCTYLMFVLEWKRRRRKRGEQNRIIEKSLRMKSKTVRAQIVCKNPLVVIVVVVDSRTYALTQFLARFVSRDRSSVSKQQAASIIHSFIHSFRQQNLASQSIKLLVYDS
jgi:hypothetical protein